MYYPMSEWKFKKFILSASQYKKYTAIIENKDGKIKKINFGDNRYSQYKDTTGLGEYTYLNNNDPERRRLYHIRHDKDVRAGQYSAGFFALKFLWG